MEKSDYVAFLAFNIFIFFKYSLSSGNLIFISDYCLIKQEQLFIL